jgi:transcriptional regulator with XRE-family HTH domain
MIVETCTNHMCKATNATITQWRCVCSVGTIGFTETPAVPISGRDLAKHRERSDLTQSELGALAGFGRHTVSYWENKPILALASPAVLAMLEALGVPYYRTSTHARVMGSYSAARASVEVAREGAPLSPFLSASGGRKKCGAQTRRGSPCQTLAIPGKQRCKFHGGRSTGPRTASGKARIAEAQRERWKHWRATN